MKFLLNLYAPLPIVKILQITKKPPFPLNDGESWAVRNLARGLKLHNCELDLLSLASELDEVERWRHEVTDIYESVEIVRHNTQPDRAGALLNLFSSKSYHQQRYEGATKSMNRKEGTLNYDLIIAETLYAMPMALYIRDKHDVPIALRSHNREHLIWQEYAKSLTGIKKHYFISQSKKLRRFELEMTQKASGVLFVSKEDQGWVEEISTVKSQVVPIALDLSRKDQSVLLSDPLIIGFLGSLDWRPNIQGLQKFLDEIWPQIREVDREVRFVIAGKNPDRSLLSIEDSNVTFIGQVEDSGGFISQLNALIVPLWSGSGARVKVLEAMSLGVPVITTAKGSEGLDVSNRQELFICSNAKDWIDVLKEIDNESFISDMRSNAREYIANSHNVKTTGEQAYHFLQGLL